MNLTGLAVVLLMLWISERLYRQHFGFSR